MKRWRTILTLLAAVCGQAVAADGPSSPPAAQEEGIPFASLEEATTTLRAKRGVKFRNEGGWIIADDSAAIVMWLLTPVGHPAYPSIVKRHIVNSAAGASMATDIRCFASKPICDKYFGGK